jgi:tRNA_anti-like
MPERDRVAVRPSQTLETTQGLQQHKTVVNVIVPSQGSNSFGIASLVVGVLSFFVCWIPIAGFIVAGLGFALGCVGFFVGALKEGRGLGFAIAGIVLSGVGLLPSLFFMLLIGGSAASRVQDAKAKAGINQEIANSPLSAVGNADDKPPAFIVGVKQALREWQDNQVVASAKYKNAWIEISGHILQIAELKDGVEVILYEPGKGAFVLQHDHVRCRFARAADVADLKTGQQVSIQGRFLERQSNFGATDLVLESCCITQR